MAQIIVPTLMNCSEMLAKSAQRLLSSQPSLHHPREAVEVFSRSQGGWIPGQIEAVNGNEAKMRYLPPGAGPSQMMSKIVHWDDAEQVRPRKKIVSQQMPTLPPVVAKTTVNRITALKAAGTGETGTTIIRVSFVKSGPLGLKFHPANGLVNRYRSWTTSSGSS